MLIHGDDSRLRPYSPLASTAKVAEILRLGRSEISETVTTAPVDPTTPEEGVTMDTKQGSLTYDVNLVPGSTRLVTTIIDTETDGILFRIPTYWSDVEAALDPEASKVYV